MTDSDTRRLARIQEVVTALIERRIAASLGELDRALARWRHGEIGALEAHDAVVGHANHAEALVKRVMAAAAQPEGVIRDAYDAGVISADDVEEITGRPPEEITAAGSLDEPSTPPPDKRTVVEDLLGRGPVLIHFDARGDEVEVPPRFKSEPKLVLRFGYTLTPAIPDLTVDERGLAGTLTFGGVPFHCVLPWTAIYAAVIDGDQRGMVWPDDIPEDLLASPEGIEPPSEGPAAPPAPPARAKRPSHLKLVD
ncbi:MAG TPA: ClpXP protease specificity-enhancing factor SspB [Kofleriaceae bacterium]|nr:ClpXP protease specificity-enhancing factor SspB [Kofleriaceae bacterium]